MPLAVFFRLRLRLSLQNTAELLNPDSFTQLGTNFGGGHEDPEFWKSMKGVGGNSYGDLSL